jgi:hypothetical protein
LYDGLPIPGSPFVVNVRRGCDPSKCRAFGPGLEHGLVDQANIFTVETKGELQEQIRFYQPLNEHFLNILKKRSCNKY